MKDKYGFIYIWYNFIKKKYYVGCHWGNTDDKYICSSNWMRNAYRKHPDHFSPRRIIKTNISTKKNLYDEENRYLQMIKEKELGKKYYNLTNKKYNTLKFNQTTISKEKISNTMKEKYKNGFISPTKGHIPWNKGLKTMTQEMKNKLAEARRNSSNGGMKNKHHSQESLNKMSISSKGQTAWNKGKHFSEKSKEKMSQSALGNKNALGYKHSEKAKEKMKLARREYWIKKKNKT